MRDIRAQSGIAPAEPIKVLSDLAAAFERITLRSFQMSEPNMAAVAVCGAVGMPLYYFIWRDLFPQPYENLSLRIVGGLMCLLLAFKDYWPEKARRYAPALWYSAILYVLPFFFTFMLLNNGSSPVWLVSSISALFLLVLLVDWLNLIVMFVVGVVAAWGAVTLSASQPGALDIPYEQLPVFVFALVAGTIFSYRRESFKRERLEAMLSVGNNIARELGPPLRGIKTGAASLRQYLPVLLQSYDKARDAGLDLLPIPEMHRRALEHVLGRLQSDIGHADTTLGMLLTNTEMADPDPSTYRIHAMAECVQAALERYPFSSEKERNLVRWRGDADFAFHGSDTVMVRILFNLLKAALTSIKRAGRGDATIKLETGGDGNRLLLRYTGIGIPTRQIPQVFDVFSTLELGSGTGPGLAFAAKALRSMGGRIVCRSEPGKFTEFEVRLLTVNKLD